MAENWEEFEDECFNYILETYGNYANFEAKGKSDSTVSDICVRQKNKTEFYIETKSPVAQCGQFVLIPNKQNNTFLYSPKNKVPFFPSTQIIIDFMNNNFNLFSNLSTAGENIQLDKKVFYDWVKAYYKSKGAKYFITKNNDFIIFPIDKIEEYFDITACYRVKKSGSSPATKKHLDEVKNLINEKNINCTLNLIENNIYLESSDKLNKTILSGEKCDFLIKSYNDKYRVRKLSNTNNANVIFTITSKNVQQNKDDLNQFENNIK